MQRHSRQDDLQLIFFFDAPVCEVCKGKIERQFIPGIDPLNGFKHSSYSYDLKREVWFHHDCFEFGVTPIPKS